MNKFLVYTVIAILLGSVTMAVPLALLGPDKLVPANSNHDTLEAGSGTEERNDVPPSSELTTQQQNDTETYDNSSGILGNEESLGVNVASGLSSIGLIIVPGFIVALGVFVYLKKGMV